MQNKPKMVEAVIFFGEHDIRKVMFFTELEAILDGVVNIEEFADRQVRAVYLLINPRLLIRSAVFFYLDFDGQGKADARWNIPLRHLADHAARGPDLGAGPIRLASRSQCPVSWHQMHLWDPDLSATRNELHQLRDTVKANRLGMLVEEDLPVELDRLQMAHEERWLAPVRGAQLPVVNQTGKYHPQQRLKTAQRLRQLRQLKLNSKQQVAELRQAVQTAQLALQVEEERNAGLMAQLETQAANFARQREDMAGRVRAAEQSGRAALETLRKQLDAGLRARLGAAWDDYKEQLAIRDTELAGLSEQVSASQTEIASLRQERDSLLYKSDDKLLERLANQGMMFVVFHPGAGHLTIALKEINRYQENPKAYVAAKCSVSESQYSQWLEHYQHPVCQASLSNSRCCAMPVDRVETPSRFVEGQSNRCSRHQLSARVRSTI